MFDNGENGYGRIFVEYEAPEGVPVVVKPRGRLAGLELVVEPLHSFSY